MNNHSRETYDDALECLVGTGLVEKDIEGDCAHYRLTDNGKREGKEQDD
jgi:predicted transcriptional regulator